MRGVEVRIVRKAACEEIIRLYREAGWWRKEYSSGAGAIGAMVRRSFCFVGAFHGKRMIGMGRSISDGVSDAYIQDVTVMPEFRGRGIGRRIIRKIIGHLRMHGIEWVGLIAEPGHDDFYRKLGFRRMNNCTPMVRTGRR